MRISNKEAFAAEQKIREFKIISLRSKRFKNQEKIELNQMI